MFVSIRFDDDGRCRNQCSISIFGFYSHFAMGRGSSVNILTPIGMLLAAHRRLHSCRRIPEFIFYAFSDDARRSKESIVNQRNRPDKISAYNGQLFDSVPIKPAKHYQVPSSSSKPISAFDTGDYHRKIVTTEAKSPSTTPAYINIRTTTTTAAPIRNSFNSSKSPLPPIQL